ncbi:MAG TPA: sigma-70 family RNA polymerase sigma factor [Actinomycetota bacterium]|nr:sigma-70 family RNA polymerase sigma factor [Actinomycetota bacterium]
MARESTPPFASDRDLVVAFQEGRIGAYDEIYRLYSARVRRVCARMLKNPQDVDEATQETFLKAYQALGRFNGQYQLGAWLSRIASNVCLDLIRSRSRSAGQVALSDEHEGAGTERGPEDIVVGENPRIHEAISGIQPLHAQALKLRALGGLSHREMAGELHMTPAQVKALLHRARSSFRRAWDQAEGWALAPVVAIRGFFSNKSGAASEASSNFVSLTPSFSPFLAERVAASAVIVAVALTGAPTAPEAPADAPRRTPSIAAGTAPREARPPAAKGRVVFARPAAPARAAAPAHGGGAATAPDPATKVLEAVGEQTANLDEKGGGRGPKHDDENGGLGEPGAASARGVVRKARKVVSEILD